MRDELIEQRLEEWARVAVERHGSDPRTHEDLAALRIAMDRSANGMCAAMAKLPAVVYACWIVHYTTQMDARYKAKAVERLTHETVSRRAYWDHLDRARFYMSGLIEWALVTAPPSAGIPNNEH